MCAAQQEKEIDGSFLHPRDVYVLLLYVRPCAGVFDGLDSETVSRYPNDPPAERPVGF